MPTLIKTIGNINNGAVTWNNAAGSAVIGSVTNAGAWTWGPAAGVSTWNTSNGGVVSTRNGSLDGTTTSGSFSSPGVNELTSNFIRTASAGVSVSSAISGYTRVRAISVTSGSSTAFSIETNTANTGVSGANVNGTETNIVSATAAGAWTLGGTGLTASHVIKSGAPTNTPTLDIISLVTGANPSIKLNPNVVGDWGEFLNGGTAGYRFKNSSNTVTGELTHAGVWTLGPAVTNNNTGQRHLVSGALYGSNVTSTDQSGVFVLGVNTRISPNTAEDGRTNTTTGGIAIRLENRTVASSQAIGFYSNQPGDTTSTAATVIGNATHAGAWTLGASSGTTEAHLIRNSATTNYGLKVMNSSAAAGASGLYVAGGSPTSSADTTAIFVVTNAAEGDNKFIVRASAKIDVSTTNWGTGGTAIGVSSNQLTTSPSARKYKENEIPLSIDSSKIYNIIVKEFDYTEDKGGGHDFGPIADDVEAILPEIVWKENGNPESIRESKMVWLILEEMKKLQSRITVLES